MEPQDDIFVFKHVDTPGLPRGEKIKRYAVSEEAKVIITEHNRIYRWRFNQESEFRAYELPDSSSGNFLGLLTHREKTLKMNNVYMDLRGFHCIITAEGGNNFYLNFKDNRLKYLKELKGVHIKDLKFHKARNESNSGSIIFAADGLISLYRLLFQQG